MLHTVETECRRHPGANPTFVSYNASAVIIYNTSAVIIYNTSAVIIYNTSAVIIYNTSAVIIYNASAVQIYSVTSSLVRFGNKNISAYLKKTLKLTTTLAL
jgi:hypothetical protein